jgi:hypothetical protein
MHCPECGNEIKSGLGIYLSVSMIPFHCDICHTRLRGNALMNGIEIAGILTMIAAGAGVYFLLKTTAKMIPNDYIVVIALVSAGLTRIPFTILESRYGRFRHLYD